MRIMTRRPATRLYGRFWSVFLTSTTYFSKGSVLLASTSRFSSLYRTFKQRDGPWLLYTVLKEKRESVSDSVQVRRTLNALAQSMTPFLVKLEPGVIMMPPGSSFTRKGVMLPHDDATSHNPITVGIVCA